MSKKVWFITGTSRGLGKAWAAAALERGDKVAATARNVVALNELKSQYGDAVLPIGLDVTDRDQDFTAIQKAHSHVGRLDVIVNNAGYGQFGFVEEVSEQEARDQIETNLFGALWITQAALPFLRAQGSGHILQVSSVGGVAAFSNTGLYHASKWALEGLSESLAQEVSSFGIHVTLIEPGPFNTDWSGDSARRARELPHYDRAHRASDEARKARATANGSAVNGDPQASARAILKIVDAENPPLRAFLGQPPLAIIKSIYADRLATWEQWQPIAIEAQG